MLFKPLSPWYVISAVAEEKALDKYLHRVHT